MSKKEQAARVLERSGIGRVARRLGSWRGALVLNYHRVGTPGEDGFDRGVWSADAESFDAQLRMVARDFEVVPPEDLLERPDARGRRILLTFDDGYRDNYDVALPILRRHGLSATFFVVPGLIDEPRVAWWDEIAWMVKNASHESFPAVAADAEPLEPGDEATVALIGAFKSSPGDGTAALLDQVAELTGAGRAPRELAAALWMTWEQVAELRDRGMGVGGHSLTHPVLAQLPREEQEREIEGCRARLADALGIEMTSFSYPVGLPGCFDDDTKDLLRRAGVKIAFAFSGGWVRLPVADPLDVPRAGVTATMSRERFASMLALPQVFSGW